MSWVVEFESEYEPRKWIVAPPPWWFAAEEEAQVVMVSWIFQVPHRKFRVRKEG